MVFSIQACASQPAQRGQSHACLTAFKVLAFILAAGMIVAGGYCHDFTFQAVGLSIPLGWIGVGVGSFIMVDLLLGSVIRRCRSSPKAAQTATGSQTIQIVPPSFIPADPKEVQPGVSMAKYQVKNDPGEQSYEDFLLSNASLNLKVQLRETILKMPEEESYEYSQISITDEEWKKRLGEKPQQTIQVAVTPEWYEQNLVRGDAYIDFAAKNLGGGYRTHGNVQEERMLCMYSKMARTDYLTQQARRPTPIFSVENPFLAIETTRPTPFIFEGCVQKFAIDDSTYGRAIDNKTEAEVKEAIKPVESAPPVTIIGIAAKNWGKGGGKYTEEILNYHLRAFYLACVAAKEKGANAVHSGYWGAGAFNNSEHMIMAIHILGARMAGIDLVLHGVKNQDKFHPGFGLADFQEIVWKIDKRLDTMTPQQIIEQLPKEPDPKWHPKKT